MSQVQQITSESFQSEVMESPIPVLIDLYATWCAPCKMMAPVLDRLAHDMVGRIKVVKIDTDEQPELAGAFRVSSIPMLVLMHKGKVVDSTVGLVPPAQILAMIEKAAPAAVAVGR